MKLKREVLNKEAREVVKVQLNKQLNELIALALLGKQLHWAVVGSQFKAVHEQLDDIIEDLRAGSDELAERVVAVGEVPFGTPGSVKDSTSFVEPDRELLTVERTLQYLGDILAKQSSSLRESIERVGEVDPISEDLLIGITHTLEKHLWMVQAQEL